MKLSPTYLSLALAMILAGSAVAQRQGSAVQLPTFSMFGLGTTVSVPDRGSVYLGGINRAATGRNEFGVPLLPLRPFKNSAIGMQRGASQMHVTATIHDFEAMDEYLLGQPTTFRSLSSQQQPRSAVAALGRTLQPRVPGAGSSWTPARPSDDQPTMSVAEARARRVRKQEVRDEEAEEFFARGQKAESEGKANVARIYYQMAARRATGELQQQVLAKLDAAGRAQAGSAVAQSGP